ncbi:MAG: hypothetical protein U0361_24760, partial [Nitrospiraceae bacterium]
MTTPSADDPYRLPRHIVPSHYDLRLEPDLASHSFSGHEIITLTVLEPANDILLNTVDLTVISAALAADGQSAHDGRVTLEEDQQRCRIAFSSAIQPGVWKLSLSFRGTLNDKLRGF